MGQANWLLRVTTLVAVGLGGLLPGLTVAAESQLEEIVVTAQKREQSLNDVGLTVNALSGDFLQTRQVNTKIGRAHV